MNESSFGVGGPLNKTDIAPQLPALSEEDTRLLGGCISLQRQISQELDALTDPIARKTFLETNHWVKAATKARETYISATGEDYATLQHRIDAALGL
jgi:hypothetical protein